MFGVDINNYSYILLLVVNHSYYESTLFNQIAKRPATDAAGNDSIL